MDGSSVSLQGPHLPTHPHPETPTMCSAIRKLTLPLSRAAPGCPCLPLSTSDICPSQCWCQLVVVPKAMEEMTEGLCPRSSSFPQHFMEFRSKRIHLSYNFLGQPCLSLVKPLHLPFPSLECYPPLSPATAGSRPCSYVSPERFALLTQPH